ncbi:MAG: hypothetical protein MUC49_21155 [Raineya sp.]|jgi:hypothetical protein|nr:hypothetical protein [Raineya sp.]
MNKSTLSIEENKFVKTDKNIEIYLEKFISFFSYKLDADFIMNIKKETDKAVYCEGTKLGTAQKYSIWIPKSAVYKSTKFQYSDNNEEDYYLAIDKWLEWKIYPEPLQI